MYIYIYIYIFIIIYIQNKKSMNHEAAAPPKHHLSDSLTTHTKDAHPHIFFVFI